MTENHFHARAVGGRSTQHRRHKHGRLTPALQRNPGALQNLKRVSFYVPDNMGRSFFINAKTSANKRESPCYRYYFSVPIKSPQYTQIESNAFIGHGNDFKLPGIFLHWKFRYFFITWRIRWLSTLGHKYVYTVVYSVSLHCWLARACCVLRPKHTLLSQGLYTTFV